MLNRFMQKSLCCLIVVYLLSCSNVKETEYIRANDTLYYEDGVTPLLVFEKNSKNIREISTNINGGEINYKFKYGWLKHVYKKRDNDYLDTSFLIRDNKATLMMIHTKEGDVVNYYSLSSEIVNYDKAKPITLFYPVSHKVTVNNVTKRRYNYFYNMPYRYIIGDLPNKKYELSYSVEIDSNVVESGDLDTNFIQLDFSILDDGYHQLEIRVERNVIDSVIGDLTYSTNDVFEFEDCIIVEKHVISR